MKTQNKHWQKKLIIRKKKDEEMEVKLATT